MGSIVMQISAIPTRGCSLVIQAVKCVIISFFYYRYFFFGSDYFIENFQLEENKARMRQRLFIALFSFALLGFKIRV